MLQIQIRIRIDKKLDFKSNAAIISCISKINNKFVNDAEDLDIVTPMSSLIA